MQIKTFDSFHGEHTPLYEAILRLTFSIGQTYPYYENWFRQTFIPGLKKKERLYIVAIDEDKETLVGCVLMKRTSAEKKICTIFVHPQYRNQGLGTQLMRQSLIELGEKPLITVSSKNISQLRSILNRFHFQLTGVKKDPNHPFKAELYFNGTTIRQNVARMNPKERTRE